jgi:hypothetical protein
VLTIVDEPSDKAPSGARGHRVILTRETAEAALPSLLGMAGCELVVGGYVFARDFPELESELEGTAGTMGMSYELAEAHVEDMTDRIWTLTRAIFTGAAILLRKHAAYGKTRFGLCSAPLRVAAGMEIRGVAAND